MGSWYPIVIMNLDGTQNNGSAFLAFFSEYLSFRKKISHSEMFLLKVQ